MIERILIVIPTYNERENVEIISSLIRKAVPLGHLLFIDDNSPDGTGVVLDQLAAHDHKISVMHRHRKMGVGSAHLDGINRAYNESFSILVTLDADLTHSPENIHELIHALEGANVVTASRFGGHGGLNGWSLKRRIITHGGHLLTRVFLRLPYDASGAFRAYRLESIPRDCFKFVRTTGYSFFYESLKILSMNHVSIVDSPIVLPARTYGHSKMKPGDIRKSVFFLLRLSIETLFRPNKFRLPN